MEKLREVVGPHDGFILPGDFAADFFGDRVDITQEVHQQRSSIEKLVDVEESDLGASLSESFTARLDGLTFVAIQPPNQQFVRFGRGPDDSVGRLGRRFPLSARLRPMR